MGTGKKHGIAMLLVLVVSMLLAACSGPERIVRAPARGFGIRGHGAMKPVVASTLSSQLRSVGLDPQHLPPIRELDRSQRLLVMETFSTALGIPCSGCHSETDSRADTRRKRIATRMWNDYARGLTLENGEPLYCDSCHQGQLFSLDRTDKDKVADYMGNELVGRLRRVPGVSGDGGKDVDCTTCHGDPPEFAFLGLWREEPAPDIKIVKAKPAATSIAAPVIAAPATQAPQAAAKPATASAGNGNPNGVSAANANVGGACGSKLNPCPLQKWMRKNIAPAITANDTQALARALEKSASFSPDPSWRWAEIARTGAEFARQGDMSAARKSCKQCHELYKAKWKGSYRTRPI